ncbi:MAG: glycine cleavage T C-terminal barrel domain-containing protein, partial [Pseudomonadota bacterium]
RDEMINQVEQNPNITVYTNATCTGWFAENYLTVMCENKMLKIRAKHVIAATGILEQPIIFRNNDLPGVMLCSAIQRLINLYGVSPGSKVLIATTSSDGYATALDLIEAGIEITAIIDYRKKQDESDFCSEINKSNITVYQNHYIEEIVSGNGTNYISSVKIKSFDKHDKTTDTIKVNCDFVGMSGGYSPAGQLICHSGGTLKYDKQLETFKVDINQANEDSSIAGSLNNYSKLEEVVSDGKYVANRCMSKIGINVETVNASSMPVNSTSKLSNFAPPIVTSGKGKDFIDFDEDLQVKDIIDAIKDGYDDLELVKRYSTVVMGPSQGKHSALNNARLVYDTKGQSIDGVSITTQRPPYHPEYIQHLAGKSYQPVKQTAIHYRHEQLNAKFFSAGSWLRPSYYSTQSSSTKCIEEEYLGIRNNVGLIDVSTLGKIEVFGKDAAEFLERIYTSTYKKQRIGRSKYVLMTDKTGSIIDDGVACRLSEHLYYVTTTSSGADNVYRIMTLWNSQWNLDVSITNLTSAYAAINLVGPKSRLVLQKVVDDIDLSTDAFEYMDVRSGHIQNIPARLVRVGFVGELGYEIHVPYTFGESLWDILMFAGKSFNIKAAGVEAQRLLRLEKGHIIVGQDTDGLTNPYDISMDWAISKSKPFFNGQRAIEVIKSKGIKKSLMGFKIEPSSKMPEECNLIISNHNIVGRITSVAYSPILKSTIGLALLSTSDIKIGDMISIKLSNGDYVNALVCSIPFYDSDNKRQQL